VNYQVPDPNTDANKPETSLPFVDGLVTFGISDGEDEVQKTFKVRKEPLYKNLAFYRNHGRKEYYEIDFTTPDSFKLFVSLEPL
jgi:hypothetical protein